MTKSLLFYWYFVFVVGYCLLVQARATPRQFHNCNNCYAVTAYEIIKHHKPRLNISVKELMEITHQGCAGGSASRILDKFFRGSKKHRGSLYKVIDLLKKHGPLIVDLNPDHLVTAWKASENGLLIHDSRFGEEKIITQKEHPLKFSFIAYPLI